MAIFQSESLIAVLSFLIITLIPLFLSYQIYKKLKYSKPVNIIISIVLFLVFAMILLFILMYGTFSGSSSSVQVLTTPYSKTLS